EHLVELSLEIRLQRISSYRSPSWSQIVAILDWAMTILQANDSLSGEEINLGVLCSWSRSSLCAI
ncbi:unnamed protein product, partial [Urochloa humidicola]